MSVVAFRGVVVPGQANEHVVKLLERLLENAKSGDIHSIAYATVDSAGGTEKGWECAAGDGLVLVAGAAILQTKLTLNSIENEACA